MRLKNLPEEGRRSRSTDAFRLFILLSSLASLVFVFREKLAQVWYSFARKLRSNKKETGRITREDLRKVDIEIRYETEKDADATLLAENVVKVIRIVLLPLAKQIKEEEAKVIFVFNGDSWEIRMKNASEDLRDAVRALLEAKEW